MTNKDQQKLLDAGFTILRPHYSINDLSIWKKTPKNRDWIRHGRYDYKAPMNKELLRLCEDTMTVQE